MPLTKDYFALKALLASGIVSKKLVASVDVRMVSKLARLVAELKYKNRVSKKYTEL